MAATKWYVLAVGGAAAAFTDIETTWIVVATFWSLGAIVLFKALREHEETLGRMSPAERTQHQEDIGV